MNQLYNLSLLGNNDKLENVAQEYFLGLNILKENLEKEGGIINLFVDTDELRQMQGGGFVSDLMEIFKKLLNPSGFKYSQELKDLSGFMLDRVKDALNPLKAKEALTMSFMPGKEVNGKFVVDRKNRLVIIFCNFMRKLVPDREEDSNDDIIDDISDESKVIDNLAEILNGFIDEILLFIDPIMQQIIKTIKSEQENQEEESDEESDVKKGLKIAGKVVKQSAAFFIPVVNLLIFGLVMIISLMCVGVVLYMYSPQIKNTLNSMMMNLNNQIANIIAIKVQKVSNPELARKYMEKFDAKAALGDLMGLSNKLISLTKEKVQKQSKKGGALSVNIDNIDESFSLYELKQDTIGDISDLNRGAKLMMKAVDDVIKQIRENEIFKTLNKFNTPFGNLETMINAFTSDIPLLSYVSIETQADCSKQLFKQNNMKGGFDLLSGAFEKVLNDLSQQNPTSLFAAFNRAIVVLNRLPQALPPNVSPYAEILVKNAKIVSKLGKHIGISEAEPETEAENQKYYYLYQKYKSKYLKLKQLV
jgi:hypothetical protein